MKVRCSLILLLSLAACDNEARKAPCVSPPAVVTVRQGILVLRCPDEGAKLSVNCVGCSDPVVLKKDDRARIDCICALPLQITAQASEPTP